MKIKSFFFLILSLAFLGGAPHVYAGSTSFNTTFPSNCGGVSQLQASTDKDLYNAGETIQVSGSWVVVNGGSCSSYLTTISGHVTPNNINSTFLANSHAPDTWSGTLTAPSAGGTQNVVFTISTTWKDSAGNTQTTSGSGSIQITVVAQTANIVVDMKACPGGTWTLNPGGYTGDLTSSVTVPADSAGSWYSLGVMPPANYAYSVSPDSLVKVFPGGTYTLSVSCQPVYPPPTATVSGKATAAPGGGQQIDLKWDSTNANSCSSLDIKALNPTGPTSGTQSEFICSTDNLAVHISCTGPGGSTPAATTVLADPNATPCSGGPGGTGGPSVNIQPKNPSVTAGSNVTLSWTSTNTTSCYADPLNPWTSNTSTSGSDTVKNIQTTTTYTMYCQDSGGNIAHDSTTVFVSTPTPPPPPPPPPPPGGTPPPSTFTGDGPPSINPNPTKVGYPTDFYSCHLSGGTAPYHYVLTSTDIPAGFSDQTGDSSQNPIHIQMTFDQPGTYGSKWYITDANGAETSCSPSSVKVLLNAVFREF